MNDKRVLIADEDESILWVLEKFFAEKKLETVKADNGTKASRLLREGRFQLAVVDINMPEKDGLEVLRERRRLRDLVHIMTADSTWEHLEAMKLGAFDYDEASLTGGFEITVERH